MLAELFYALSAISLVLIIISVILIASGKKSPFTLLIAGLIILGVGLTLAGEGLQIPNGEFKNCTEWSLYWNCTKNVTNGSTCWGQPADWSCMNYTQQQCRDIDNCTVIPDYECNGTPELDACFHYNQTQCLQIEGCHPHFLNCDNVSWWLAMDAATGGAGTELMDSCDNYNFTRAGTTTRVPGWWDWAQYFNGSDEDSWAHATNNASANITTGSRTWRAVVNIHNWGGSSDIYSDNETLNGVDWSNFLMWEQDNGVYCYCRDNASNLRTVFSGVLALNTWEDILCTYNETDDGNLSVYWNGTLQASGTGSYCNYPIGQGQPQVGQYPIIGGQPKENITLDGVFYYRNAVTPWQAMNLYLYNAFSPQDPYGFCHGAPDTCYELQEYDPTGEKCLETEGCNLTDESYCTGTPDVTCTDLLIYDPSGFKCQETKGCEYTPDYSYLVNATCDSVNDTCNTTWQYLNLTGNWNAPHTNIDLLYYIYILGGVFFIIWGAVNVYENREESEEEE